MLLRIPFVIIIIACLVTFFGWIGISAPSFSTGQPFHLTAAVGTIARNGPSGPILPTPTNPVMIAGTVVLDTQSGGEAIPYIAYYRESGKLATKQLIFAGRRGCDPRAGDLVCVLITESAYPDLSEGERIVVNGTFQQDRFVVTRLERL